MKTMLLLFILCMPLVGFNQEQDVSSVKGELKADLTEVSVALQAETPSAVGEPRDEPTKLAFRQKIPRNILKLSEKKSSILSNRISSKHSRPGRGATGIFLILGLLVMIAGFAFIIVAAYTSWWLVLIGLGGIIGGFLIMCLFAAIEGGDMAWLGPIVMSFFGLITGGAMLAIWGIIELIKWLIN